MKSSPVLVLALLASPMTSVAFGLDDWDLYALKLVNRARQDPAGEAARIGSTITDSTPPRPPLAYHALVGNAATNHSNWMHDNFGALDSEDGPDSFTHFETMDGLASGSPATGTPSFSGVDVGTRVTAAGFSWDRAAENIITLVSTEMIPIDQLLIDDNHWVWWESDTHRAVLLSSNYALFGHHTESRVFAPPLGGIDAPFSNINYATQDFARPSAVIKTHILGVLYKDVDGDGAWTPRAPNSPQKEGLGGISYTVYIAGTTSPVVIGTTLANGAFSINRVNGTYDIQFAVGGTPTGKLRIENVVVAGQNVDAGDHNTLAIAPADFNGDRRVDQDDLDVFKACSTRTNVPYNPSAPPPGCPAPVGSSFVAPDFDRDQDVDMSDYAVFQRCYSGTSVAAAHCAG